MNSFMQSSCEDIVTPRVVLRLMGWEVIEAILCGDLDYAERILNLQIPQELLDNSSTLKYTRLELKRDSSYLPWSARAIISKDQHKMIGIIRFHSSPRPIEFPGRDGLAVEFGYRVFLTYRSNGYATEAVKAMMDWSQLHYGINKYLASVSPDNLISNRLISSFGFWTWLKTIHKNQIRS
jgi:ribosomal-protein-alanine N-acetyltransferase